MRANGILGASLCLLATTAACKPRQYNDESATRQSGQTGLIQRLTGQDLQIALISSGDKKTTVFHWTRDPLAVDKPKAYIASAIGTAKVENSKSRLDDFPESKPAGHGFYVWSDPLQASTQGSILVTLSVKPQRSMGYLGFLGRDPWAEINEMKGEGQDYWLNLKKSATSAHDALFHFWGGGVNLQGGHSIVVRSEEVLDVSDVQVFDGRSAKAFSDHQALSVNELLSWTQVLKVYADQMQFVRDYLENPQGMRDGRGRLTDLGVVAAIYSEMFHELPAVKQGFQNLFKTDASKRIPRCASEMESSKVIGLLVNLEMQNSCKLVLRKALEAGLTKGLPESADAQASGGGSGAKPRFGNEPPSEEYLEEAISILKETGYLDAAESPADFESLTQVVVARWRKGQADTRVEELMSGVEVMKTEFATRSLEKWKAPDEAPQKPKG